MKMRFVVLLCAVFGVSLLAGCNISEILSQGDDDVEIDPDDASSVSPSEEGVSFRNQTARLLFGNVDVASRGVSTVYGGYSLGCLAGAQQLDETGPTWQAMRLSRNRNWGHPYLIDFIEDITGQVAQQTSWNGLYVGDMAQPRGGPMLTGHVSHQSGLDVDIWMLRPGSLSLTQQERETLSSISTRADRGARVGENWTQAHMDILRMVARDPRVARVFVFPGAKVWMCENETGDREYLNRIRPANGHHYHFHVRLNCPGNQRHCVEQAAPPPGDGCDEAREWAASINAPPPPPVENPTSDDTTSVTARPTRGAAVSVGQLPRQCARLVSHLR
jgi:penicillin-insensitive murein endopeptidase